MYSNKSELSRLVTGVDRRQYRGCVTCCAQRPGPHGFCAWLLLEAVSLQEFLSMSGLTLGNYAENLEVLVCGSGGRRLGEKGDST